MGDFFTLFNVKDLNLVEVRSYCGIEGNQHAWIFLGYDVVRTDENGKAISVLAKENKEYDYLKKINFDDEENRKKYVVKTNFNDISMDYYDHDGLVEGDIRVKVVENARERVFGKKPIVSVYDIKRNIEKNSNLYFLHQSKKESAKVKEKIK